MKRASGDDEPWRTSATETGYTSPHLPVSGVQSRVRVWEPAAQTPGPLAGTLALESGTTVTQVEALSPPAEAATGTEVSRSSGVAVGVPDVACCSWERSSRRP